ncbi:hypothetical protein QLH32_17615 [Acinetobacter corruptisaponis]|uniref:Bacteriophage T5 Orf172 DNA-binding domain-containing protein n=1 Tax=Acinetobacter corruptisaponis TaxID=3045147 RepID=A0ABY8S5L6_9GAMM|nr:GIY-YIG nuclease family protein [Acinetobacter sp. KCTC 92772]WHP05797.1 hypothetical protein QLH32_17615 [Acinetobacter sp. KCTC 92772]
MKPLTQNDFVEKAIKIHGDKYDYSDTLYISSKQKIKIICKTHGLFEQTPNSHLGGQGCAKCSEKQKWELENLIIEFNKIHNNKYEYSNIKEYKNNKQKLNILCKTHGVFKQSTNTHLSGIGCPKCGLLKRAFSQKKKNTDAIECFISVHGDKYLYDQVDYKGKNKEVIIGCKIHGYFYQNANNHQQGAGCPSCGNQNKAKSHRIPKVELLNRLNILHGDRLFFDINQYRNQNSFIEVICYEHGKYKQKIGNLLAGHGCPKCGLLSPLIRKDYLKICNKYDGMSHIYLIRCLKDEEEFFKVGIARSGVADRYKDKNKFPYDYEILYEIKGEAGYIWDLEKQIHKLLKEFHYTPKLYFKGCVNECFSKIPAPICKLFKKVDSVQIGLLA